MIRFSLIGFLMLFAIVSQGQTDTLPIDLAKLGWQDLRSTNSLELNRQVSSASRSLKNIAELPFSIIVIGAEEIRQNGYITLTDVLKMLPGFRISPSGSAIEGELFMMRGLPGNSYAKILLNGIPIKPYMVNGMPLGAQLPIQQAERIEIIYGPAAALYGADASSGIINIVVKESERPVFADASLHVGSQEYFSLNALFGGKLGQGDDVLRFKVYGSNTRFADRRVVYDEETLYNPLEYNNILPARAQNLTDNRNYRGNPNRPVINELPHLSRSFGADLQYRFLQLSYVNLQRQDHSSIGLSPLSASYAIPLNFTGETIEEGHLTAKSSVKNIDLQTTAGFLRYELDSRSSITYVAPVLQGIMENFAQESTDPESASQQIFSNFYDRSRFMKSRSREFYLEQTANFNLLPSDEWTVGLKYQLGDGDPFIDFQPVPVQREDFEPANLEASFSDPSYQEFSAFFQWFLSLKRWSILVGGQYFNRGTSDFNERITSFSPRLAILFKASDKLSLRASYGKAFKIPSPFLSASSYTIREETFDNILTGIIPLGSEQTYSFELGLRWKPSINLEWDVSSFYSRTSEYVIYNFVSNPRIETRNLTIGYFNNEDTETKLWGLQSFLRINNIIPKFKLDAQLGMQISTGEESFFSFNPQMGSREDFISGIQSIRAYPNLMTQLRLQFKPLERVSIILDNVFMSRNMSRNILEIGRSLNMGVEERELKQNEYYLLDVSANLLLSPNLELYGKILNFFNTKYAGIDANDGPDVLLYNPQSLSTFRFGINYHLK